MSKIKHPKIDLYTSAKNGAKYLSVMAGVDVATLQLPADVDKEILTLSPFKTRLELDPNKPKKAINQDEVKRLIDTQGYAIHEANFQISVGVTS